MRTCISTAIPHRCIPLATQDPITYVSYALWSWCQHGSKQLIIKGKPPPCWNHVAESELHRNSLCDAWLENIIANFAPASCARLASADCLSVAACRSAATVRSNGWPWERTGRSRPRWVEPLVQHQWLRAVPLFESTSKVGKCLGILDHSDSFHNPSNYPPIYAPVAML